MGWFGKGVELGGVLDMIGRARSHGYQGERREFKHGQGGPRRGGGQKGVGDHECSKAGQHTSNTRHPPRNPPAAAFSCCKHSAACPS